MHGENPFVLSRFQTRLLCIQKKPCLRSKEALFVVQRSLVCKPGKTRLPRNAAIGRLPAPSAWSARQLPAHEKRRCKNGKLIHFHDKSSVGRGQVCIIFRNFASEKLHSAVRKRAFLCRVCVAIAGCKAFPSGFIWERPRFV